MICTLPPGSPGFAYNFPVTKLIQVDIDASEIARNYPVDVGVVGDTAQF